MFSSLRKRANLPVGNHLHVGLQQESPGRNCEIGERIVSYLDGRKELRIQPSVRTVLADQNQPIPQNRRLCHARGARR